MADATSGDQAITLSVAPTHAAMDGCQLASSLVGALAWPVAAIVIALVFRSQIAGLLKRVKAASWGETKVNFADALDKVEAGARPLELAPPNPGHPIGLPPAPLSQRFETLLAMSPNLAIIDSWSDLERSLRVLAQRHGVTGNIENMRPDQLALGLKSKGTSRSPR